MANLMSMARNAIEDVEADPAKAPYQTKVDLEELAALIEIMLAPYEEDDDD